MAAEDFGPAILKARASEGWSQAEVGRRANLHPSHVAKIERGERCGTLPVVIRLAQTLGIDLNALKDAAA